MNRLILSAILAILLAPDLSFGFHWQPITELPQKEYKAVMERLGSPAEAFQRLSTGSLMLRLKDGTITVYDLKRFTYDSGRYKNQDSKSEETLTAIEPLETAFMAAGMVWFEKDNISPDALAEKLQIADDAMRQLVDYLSIYPQEASGTMCLAGNKGNRYLHLIEERIFALNPKAVFDFYDCYINSWDIALEQDKPTEEELRTAIGRLADWSLTRPNQEKYYLSWSTRELIKKLTPDIYETLVRNNRLESTIQYP